MSKFYEPLKTIVKEDDWKIVEENEHTLACSCNGLNGWAISGMSVVEYSQRRLAFFRDNRLIGEIKLYDLDLAGQVVDEYMTAGSLRPCSFPWIRRWNSGASKSKTPMQEC